MRGALCCLLLVTIVGAGCGSDEQPPPSDEGEIAALVNGYFADLLAGDAEAACARLSDRGAAVLIQLAELGSGEDAIGDCERAASVYGRFLTEAEAASEGASKQVFAADDVEVAGGKGAVSCEPRGGVLLEQVDGEWLIKVPACVD